MNLTVENITFSFTPGINILQDISFSALNGETLCILGSSGSGKSTLLRIIADLLPSEKAHQFSGNVLFDSRKIEVLKKEGSLSYMFQEATLMPNLTVRENVEFPLSILKKTFKSTVEDTIEIVGLSKSINQFPKNLSGGMRTRTALARSFITQPKLLLLDEPFSSLDFGWKNDLYNELRVLQKRDNTCVVMVTHDIDEALQLANKILILSHEGKYLKSFDVTSLNKSDIKTEASQLIVNDHQLFLNNAQ